MFCSSQREKIAAACLSQSMDEISTFKCAKISRRLAFSFIEAKTIPLSLSSHNFFHVVFHANLSSVPSLTTTSQKI